MPKPIGFKEHYALRAYKWHEQGDGEKCLRDLDSVVTADWANLPHDTDGTAVYAKAASYLLDHLTLTEAERQPLTEMRTKYA